ncbi:hypothetical protein PC9H_007070 [Pleurotus ostreatus]|uniref:Acetyl-CoA synthetase-like protein n=1 Tax=Pleurotus ostreatus TaxID=5322 RepID=A0A8H6ZSQ7_PLEOS|nr:uncharacterized protein PC9H_007070 [Pleurotus ostreatus]KAF7427854.1 hypothetical protein PC9H_007070 [Pleurotus ostreatus]KAJ8695859.1 hypothetical protein PTI98_005775 [Pleurotus ostreatus]
MSSRLSLPPLPKTQALTSSTFKIPPLDGSLSVPELYDWHYCHKTEHPVFVFPGENDQQTIIKWPELVRAIHTGARLLRGLMKAAGNPSVVAIFTTSETFTYFTLIAATFRAGFVPFLISHRNSAEALAFLFAETHVDHVLVDRGTELQEVLGCALRLMQQTYPRAKIPPYSEVPLFEELFRNEDSFRLLPPYRPEMDTLAMILHSSGSTAYPKAIRWTHMQMLQLGFVPFFGERDLTGSRLSCHAMPMSHGTGMMQTVWTASMGIVITAAAPKSPGIPPTPNNVIASAQATSTDIIFCVPMYIETWSHDPRTVDFLSNIDGLLFCGALLNKDIGDTMTQKGVSIFNLYGCAEAGIISPIIPRHSGLDWEYFTVSNQMEWRLIPNGLGQSRLAIMPTPYHTPLVVNGKVDGKDATFTDDLFIAHPTKRGYFKLFGRVDDQIEHATGEITNPVPIENLLNQDPHIRASVIFGRGQFNLGVTVDPTQSFDPHDKKQLAEFRDAIWPTIERVNKIAPRHSHLLKEMILVALPTKPLEYTAKNTARRQRIIAHYKAEIDALYQEANRSSLTDLSLDFPQKWDLNSARCFVGTVVKTALGLGTLRDDDDFRHNCDSRQSTLVTNTIVRALRDTTRANTNDIADTLLDHHTSINKLATFCVKFAAKASYLAESVGDYQIIVDNMEEMLERFGSNFTERSGCFTHKGIRSNDDDDVFLVTGTTGFLGATLLGHLLQSKNTRRVYAVNRGDNDGVSLASRQETAFRNLGLSVDLITRDNKLVLVEASISDERAGLTSALIEEIRSSVTHMLLNAWPTDPDTPLQAFEPTFKSIRTLIDIALSSYRPKLPTVMFVSSMEVISSSQRGTTALELAVNADASTKTGHTQAKWVAESICLNATRTTSLRTRIVRPGRLCGSTNGYWRNPGWIQGIVETSKITGFLPDIGGDKELSWVPVEDASRVILELLEGDQDGIFHLVHPKPVAASLVLGWIASALDIPVVPPQEWLSHLKHIHTGSDMSINPESLDEVQWGPQQVNISQCSRSSATMSRASIRQISEEEVLRWIGRWAK